MKFREEKLIATRTTSLAPLLRRRRDWDGRVRDVSIDDLLSWTFRTELPKANRADEGWGGPAGIQSSSIATLGLLGTRVQISRRGGSFMPGGDDTPPDPDALLIAEAVAGLDSLIIDLDDVDLLDDAAFEELTAEEKQDAHLAARSFVLEKSGRLRSSLSATVITLAVLEREAPTRVVEPVKRPHVPMRGLPPAFLPLPPSVSLCAYR